MEKAPADQKKSFEGAVAAVSPYLKAGKLTPITGDMEITPGVRTQAAHGHTPGHTTYVIENGGENWFAGRYGSCRVSAVRKSLCWNDV